MFRLIVWIAAGCVVLIVVMALLRGHGSEPRRAAVAPPEGVASAEPVIAPPAPAPKAEAPKAAAPEPTDADQQVQDDAAAVGMTTAPEPDSAPPT